MPGSEHFIDTDVIIRPLTGDDPKKQAVLDLIGALDTGRPPERRGERARKTIEIIVAAYESAYRRGRIDLPLVGVLDCPLECLTQRR